LANTNKNTDGIFSSVDCGEFYRQTFLSVYPLVNTDRNILSVYTEGIEVEKEGIKKTRKIQWHVTLPITLPTELTQQ